MSFSLKIKTIFFVLFEASMEPPGQIGSGNDMDMIKSYGGPRENQQSSTMEGGTIIKFEQNHPI